jgi:parallel beta-helix repeat protein
MCASSTTPSPASASELVAQRGNGVQLYNTTGARIEHNHISFVRDALYVDVSHHAIFRGNKLHHSRYGTHYMNSYRNLWEDNDTYHNRGGLALMEVRDQVVRNNRAWGNSDHGIMLRTLQDSVIENNMVAGNSRGFFIYDVEYATLRNNLVVDNVVGVHLAAGPPATGGGQRLHRQPRAGALRGRARRALGRRTAATTGATTWAGTATATAWAMCPTRPTTWWTA